MHELTHVWQYHMGYAVTFYAADIAMRGGYGNDGKAGPAPAYRYDLLGKDAGKAMSQFNMEQQAELVSHYFDALHLSGGSRHYAEHKSQLHLLGRALSLSEFLCDMRS